MVLMVSAKKKVSQSGIIIGVGTSECFENMFIKFLNKHAVTARSLETLCAYKFSFF